MQRLMGFREPIMVIGKRSRPKVGELAQRVVDDRVISRRRARSRVRCQIFELPLVRLGHCSPGSKALSALAAVCGGFDRDASSLPCWGIHAAAAFFTGAFLAVALLPGADFAVRAIASSSCARKPAISSRRIDASAAREAEPRRRLVDLGRHQVLQQVPISATRIHDLFGELGARSLDLVATSSRPACFSSARAVAAAFAWVLLVTPVTMLM